MANNTLDKAIAAIPNFGKRIKLFTEKLRIAQYADNSIYDYRLKIAQDEMKPILFLVAHFSKYLMRKKMRQRNRLLMRWAIPGSPNTYIVSVTP